jgi:DNA adenine methylase
MLNTEITPALKWVGGKTQLLESIRKKIPSHYNNYFEPFVGGAAVLLCLQPKQATINDINEQLINLYRQLKTSVEDVIKEVQKLDLVPCTKERYYTIREWYNKKIEANVQDVESAAIMIWLNKHCFNGLYRVNKKGLFNVPYNNRVNGKSIDENNIRAIGQYLKNEDINITCKDFEDACADVKPGDFVYFDSPYVPESETADFTDYSKEGFSLEDHKRLADLFRKLDKMGAKVMLSNNDVSLVRDFYAGYNIQSLDVKRMINRNANKRMGKEVLITNY